MDNKLKNKIKNTIIYVINGGDYYNGEQIELNNKYGLYIKLEESYSALHSDSDLPEDAVFIELNEIDRYDDGDDWWEPVDGLIYFLSDSESIPKFVDKAINGIEKLLGKYNIVTESFGKGNKTMIRRINESTIDSDELFDLMDGLKEVGIILKKIKIHTDKDIIEKYADDALKIIGESTKIDILNAIDRIYNSREKNGILYK